MANKLTRITSPVGVARWPALKKPDTKYNKDKGGSYKVDLILSKEDAAALMKQIKAEMNNALEQFKDENPRKSLSLADPPFETVKDDKGKPTGEIAFKFRQWGHVVNKKEEVIPITIPMFDAKGKKITPNVGGGSKLKVTADLFPWMSAKDKTVGIKLRLKAVQILDLVEYGGGNASSYGFAEEDGYNAPESDDDEVSEEGEDENLY